MNPERKILQEAIDTINNIPQPEGKVVAEAYRDGRLEEPSTMLHVIAVLLRRAKPQEPPQGEYQQMDG